MMMTDRRQKEYLPGLIGRTFSWRADSLAAAQGIRKCDRQASLVELKTAKGRSTGGVRVSRRTFAGVDRSA